MYASADGLAGYQSPNEWFVPDTTQRHTLGFSADFVDPYWGCATMVYGKASGAIAKGTVCMFDELYNALAMPATALQGFPVCIAMNKMATLTYGWFLVAGMGVFITNATVAADAGISVKTTAGAVGAVTAGQSIIGVRNRISATGTVVKTAISTINGSSVLYMPQGYDGLSLGMALSGTGLAGSSLVAKLGADGCTVYTGSAIGTVDKTATASASVTITGTYTGYGVGMFMYAAMQGPIT